MVQGSKGRKKSCKDAALVKKSMLGHLLYSEVLAEKFPESDIFSYFKKLRVSQK